MPKLPTPQDVVSNHAATCRCQSWERASLDEKILRISAARNHIASQIAKGEDWLLPIFTRLRDDLAELEGQRRDLEDALTVAECAAPSRAA